MGARSLAGPHDLKGVLDEADARDAVRFGVEAIVVSNHGGRQLDGAPSVARMLPRIADAVGDDLLLFADSGVRSGLDVLRLLALGAKGVLLGRAYAYALAAAGRAGVENMLDIFAAELRVGMMLCGVGEVKGVGAGDFGVKGSVISSRTGGIAPQPTHANIS